MQNRLEPNPPCVHYSLGLESTPSQNDSSLMIFVNAFVDFQFYGMMLFLQKDTNLSGKNDVDFLSLMTESRTSVAT